MSESDTRTKILDSALELVQTRGYNAFSYHDLADRIGIKTASIHYHFRTKGDLGQALVRRHRQVLAGVFARLHNVHDPLERLRQYAQMFRSTLENGHQMCICGILAIEYQTLPPALVTDVRGFFQDNERWLASTLESGVSAGVMLLDKSSDEIARTLFAALEGAMLAARTFGDFDRFDVAAAWHLAQLTHRRGSE